MVIFIGFYDNMNKEVLYQMGIYQSKYILSH